MAKWALSCGNCHTDFPESTILSSSLLDFFDPKKPIVPSLPPEDIECPNCGQKDLYQTTDLLYR